MKTLKLALAFLIVLLVPIFLVSAVYGQTSQEDSETVTNDTDDNQAKLDELNKQIEEYKSKLQELSGQKQTLSSTIAYLDTQINLTQAEIYKTEKELEILGLEILELSGKIESLDYSLDDLTKIFITRVKQAYIQRAHEELSIFTSRGLPDFVRRVEYVKRVQDHDQAVLIALEKSRLDYDNQKTAKEEKQTQVELLQSRLENQKNTLDEQKVAKATLLEQTKNDEKRYQQLLAEAQRQLASFSRFVGAQGGASILSNQTKCDDWGCYYNQRDSQWGNQGIGLSSSSMAEYGCLVTSMSMIASHYGKSLTPGNIAASPDPFLGTTAYMLQGTWTVAGVTMNRTRLGSSLSLIDSELEAGRPVIVGIYGGPDHFLVITKKEGDDYIMHDPFPEGGHNIKFTSRYPLSAISVVDRVTVN